MQCQLLMLAIGHKPRLHPANLYLGLLGLCHFWTVRT